MKKENNLTTFAFEFVVAGISADIFKTITTALYNLRLVKF